MDYGISSRDYLNRAVLRLSEKSPESLFYAAFELRCGVEQRMRTYLTAWKHVSKSKKKGWQIAKLSRNIEQVFKDGDKYVELQIGDETDSDEFLSYFYTPVSKQLKERTEKLGKYLHSITTRDTKHSNWHESLREEVALGCSELAIANLGRLLGPPILEKSTNNFELSVEVLSESENERLNQALNCIGRKLGIQVRIYDEIPLHLLNPKPESQ